GGGRVMVEEGLFAKFPCDAVFALHNRPGIEVGRIAVRPGPLLAASDRWDIRIKACGTHAAHPHLGIDPFVIGARIVLALQTIASRNVDPLEAAAVSVGFIKGGSAYNVIPDDLHIGGTSRSFRPEVSDPICAASARSPAGSRRCTGPAPRPSIAATTRPRSIIGPRPNLPRRS